MRTGFRLTAPESRDIIAAYTSGESAPAIARRYGTHPSTVHKLLVRHNVPRRSRHDAQRRHTINHAAFDAPSEARSYWTGFLMADGCVFHRGESRQIILALAHRDRAHVVAFRDFLGASHTVSDGNNGSRFARVAVTSRRIAAKLATFGVVPNKSHIAHARKGMQRDRHFWRGVVDGDGTISHVRDGRLELVGSYELLMQFRKFLVARGTSCSSPSEHKAIFRVVSENVLARAAIRLLYRGCMTALPRKRALTVGLMG